MRVVIVGASGNVGTSVLAALAAEDAVDSILGIARRLPRAEFPKTEWREANIETAALEPHFIGADTVVHLAWRIQPSRDLGALRRTNVEGGARVFRAAASAGVPTLVYASSVGVYSPGPKDRLVERARRSHGFGGEVGRSRRREPPRAAQGIRGGTALLALVDADQLGDREHTTCERALDLCLLRAGRQLELSVERVQPKEVAVGPVTGRRTGAAPAHGAEVVSVLERGRLALAEAT
jgi:hypothetical protein